MIIISNQLYFIYSSGLPISTSMSLIRTSTNNKLIKESFLNIEEELLKGSSLSHALESQGIYPSLFINMIRVGEASGEMDNILQTLNTYYEKSKKHEDEIKNALIYPITVFIVLLISIIIISIFLLPTYTKVFSGLNIEMPKILVFFTNVNKFIKKNVLYIIFTVIIGIVIFVKFLATNKGKVFKDYVFIKFPLTNKLTIKIINFRFAQSMSILYTSGVPIIESLKITNDLINNHYVSIDLNIISSKVKDGNKLSDSLLDSDYFSDSLISLVKVGEHSGFLGEALKKSSSYLESELDSMIVKLNKFIEPTINLVLGLIIFFIMMLVIIPSLSLGYEIM